MSTLSVAKKDFLDVRRAKIIWFVGGLYTLLSILFFYFGQHANANPDVENQLGGLAFTGALFIPLIALIATYLAIAGERESGSIKYLLSLPNSRRDVVLGKFLSRSAVVTASVLFAFGVGALLTVLLYPELKASMFASVAGLTVIYTLTYVAIAIGISAATDSRSRAMGWSIGFYFVGNIMMIFDGISLVDGLEYVLTSVLSLDISDNTFDFIQRLTPTDAFIHALDPVFSTESQMMRGADLPFYLEPEAAFVILLAWLVVPIVLGLVLFGRADLG